jgi:hypothetical protein
LVFIPEDAQHALKEMMCILIGVKADEVCPQESLQEISTPLGGKQPKHFKGWERNVQKESQR